MLRWQNSNADLKRQRICGAAILFVFYYNEAREIQQERNKRHCREQTDIRLHILFYILI